MKKTLKEILFGSAELAVGEPNSQMGCGFFIALLGLVLLIAPMANDGEKPLILTVISVILIIISIVVIVHRFLSIKKEEKVNDK